MQGTRDTSAPVLVECTRCCAPPFQTELDHQNMEELKDLIHDPTVLAVATLVGAATGVLAIAIAFWLSPSRKAVKRLEEQARRLEEQTSRLGEFLDGLRETKNRPLRIEFEHARILQLEGYAAQSAHKHKEAIDRFTRALELAETDSQRAALHVLRGNSHLSISEYNEAEADYQESLKLAQRISPAKDAAQARAAALGGLGIVHRHRGDLDKAEKQLNQALDIQRQIGDLLGEANQLGNLGNVYLQRGDVEKAEEHHKDALKLHREIGDRLGEAQNLGNLGLVYAERGELEKAEEHHQKALEIDREIGNRLGEASNLGNLGIVYRRRGELEKAQQHYQQALEIDRETGRRLGEAIRLGNLGNVYLQRGELDKAEEHHQQALEIDRKIGNRLGEAQDLGNLGLVYKDRGDIGKAREYLQQAQTIYQKIGAGGPGPANVRRWLEELEELERRQQERGE